MIDFLILFVAALLGTFGFAVLFEVEKKAIAPATLLGGLTYAVYYGVYLLSGDLFVSNLVGAFFAALAAYGLAVFFRAPTVMFHAAAVIPLVPGAGLYYTMYGLIEGNLSAAFDAGSGALRVGLGIAAGIILGGLIVNLIRPLSAKRKHRSFIFRKSNK